MVNSALFDKIAAQIEETPDLYDQGVWAKKKQIAVQYVASLDGR